MKRRVAFFISMLFVVISISGCSRYLGGATEENNSVKEEKQGLLFSTEYEVQDYFNGYFIVSKLQGKLCGVIDDSGNEIIPLKYTSVVFENKKEVADGRNDELNFIAEDNGVKIHLNVNGELGGSCKIKSIIGTINDERQYYSKSTSTVYVADSTKKKLFHPKEYQLYIGRILLLIIIGFMQSALICLGDLFFLGIQCKHPVMFVLTGMFTSFVYVNLIYALTVSFGDIGKAIAVVLMVMQVAGSGGTFPIQCAPKFFQVVYPLLPFTHSMNAMRECIAGFYGTTYATELGKLAIFLAPSLLLGLLLRKPIIKMNDAFMEKLESTHLI